MFNFIKKLLNTEDESDKLVPFNLVKNEQDQYTLQIIESEFNKLFKYDPLTVMPLNKSVTNNTNKHEQSITIKKNKTKQDKNNKASSHANTVYTEDVAPYDFNHYILRHIPPVLYITARRGAGKTALLLKIAENYSFTTKKLIFTMGLPKEDLPIYFIPINDVNEIHQEGMLLIDEAGLLTFDIKKDLENLVKIARHKGLTVLFAGQTLKQLPPRLIEMFDGTIFKKPTPQQYKHLLVRQEYKKTMKLISDNIKVFDNPAVFYFDGDFESFYTAPLPSFWNEDISKNQKKKQI